MKNMTHKSDLPFQCFEKNSGKIILKLIADQDATKVSIIYGDPFMYVNTKKKDKDGNEIWEWGYTKNSLEKQHVSDKHTMWRIELDPPKTRRLKYAFVITDESGEEYFYSEEGLKPYSEDLAGLAHNHFFFPFAHLVDAYDVPKWVEEVCWYQIFPERFCNGNPQISPDNSEDWETGTPKVRNFFGGDIQGIINNLQYLKNLGVTGLYLTPVFLSPSNHKYDTQDYLKIDPHFGDLDVMKDFVKKAHDLGLKVMLDAVFNHIGSKHEFWQDVIKNQEKSKYKDYFHIHNFPVLNEYNARLDLNYDAFAFSPSMPKWNTENPEARKYLIDAACYWITECDIDGWRLDVSDEVSFSFWHDFKKAIDKCKKDFYIVGEIWHNPSKWLGGKYFDAVMNYPLGRVISELFVHNKISPDDFNLVLMEKLMRFSDMHTRVQFNLLDSHDTARVLTQAGGDKLAMKNAFMYMMMMKGSPCIYYGTEIGMEGDRDPDCRRPMIWDETRQDGDLLQFFKELIKIRKKYIELIQNASISYVRENDICRWVLEWNGERLGLVFNFGDKDMDIGEKFLLVTKDRGNGVLGGKVLGLV